jgi:tetratricopeptide (TPR) repeat protein
MVHLLVVFAAYAIIELIRMIRGAHSRRRLLVSVGVSVPLALFCNLDLFGYQKEHQPYLRCAYAIACLNANRDDLLDDAVAHFEQDLEADLAELRRQNRRSNTTLLLDHCSPMRLLLRYYLKKGDFDRALQAAHQLLDRNEVDGFLAVQVFGLCEAGGDRSGAKSALAIIQRDSETIPADLAADCFARYGMRWSDATALRRAMELYRELYRAYPERIDYHTRLQEIRARLKDESKAP